jgi:hypothetical protein
MAIIQQEVLPLFEELVDEPLIVEIPDEDSPVPVARIQDSHASEENIIAAINECLRGNLIPGIGRRVSPSEIARFLRNTLQGGFDFIYDTNEKKELTEEEILIKNFLNELYSELLSIVFTNCFVNYGLNELFSADALRSINPGIDTRTSTFLGIQSQFSFHSNLTEEFIPSTQMGEEGTNIQNFFPRASDGLNGKDFINYYWGDIDDPRVSFRLRILSSFANLVDKKCTSQDPNFLLLRDAIHNSKVEIFETIDRLLCLFNTIDWENIVTNRSSSDSKPSPRISVTHGLIGNFYFEPPFGYVDLAMSKLEEVRAQIVASPSLVYLTKGDVINIVGQIRGSSLPNDLASKMEVFLHILNVAAQCKNKGFKPFNGEYRMVTGINPYDEELWRLISNANFFYFDRDTSEMIKVNITFEEIPTLLYYLKFFVETSIVYSKTLDNIKK